MAITVAGSSLKSAAINGIPVKSITIDGQTVWSAISYPIMIENFEVNNFINKFNLKSGNPNFTQSTAKVYEGSYSAEYTATSNAASYLYNTNTSYSPPKKGQIFSVMVNGQSNSHFCFGVQNESNMYRVSQTSTDPTNISLIRISGGTAVTLATINQAVNTGNIWQKWQISWGHSGNISISTISSQGSFTMGAIDNTHGNGGFGFYMNMSSKGAALAYFDIIQIDGEV